MKLKISNIAQLSWLTLFGFVFLLSCHDDNLLDVGEQPLVSYLISVTDSATGLPLGGVKVQVVDILLDTSKYTTDSAEGSVSFEVESSQNLISLSKTGYRRLDTLLEVTEKQDSVFGLPIRKTYSFKLVDLNQKTADTLQNIQYRILVRDQNLKPLTSASITFTDSLGNPKLAVDENEDGRIIITSLGLGKHLVLVEQPGYLGQYLEISLQKGANDSTTQKFVGDFAVTLLPLSQKIEGQLFQTVAGKGSVPLEGAMVVFSIEDTLQSPRSFKVLSDDEGMYLLDSLPPLAGKLEYFLTDTSTEPSKIVEMSKENLILDRLEPPVEINPLDGAAGIPLLIARPSDTLASQNPMIFKFNQELDPAELEVKIKEVNVALNLLVEWNVSSDGKTLEVWLKDSIPWKEGIVYEYQLIAKNLFGEFFKAASQSGNEIQGFSYIEPTVVENPNLKFPDNFKIAYFNSGTSALFDSNSATSSQYADSTSNMALLRWENPSLKSGEQLVDSVAIYIRDEDNFTNWSHWLTIAAEPDSLQLFFFSIYSTYDYPSVEKPAFPIMASPNKYFELQFVPKQHNTLYQDNAKILSAPIKQGMGERVNCKIELPDTMLITGPGVSPEIPVSFVFANDTNEAVKISVENFSPTVTVTGGNVILNPADLEWTWTNVSNGRSHTGTFTYSGSGDLRFLRFEFTLPGAKYLNLKGEESTTPLWVNREKNFFSVPRQAVTN